MGRLTIACAVAALAVVSPAGGAAAPFPSQQAGSGAEPTAGRGSFGGVPFHARSAAIQWDGTARTLTLYLFGRPDVRCSGLHRAVAIRRGRSVQVLVTRRAAKLPIDRAIGDRFVRFVKRFGATDVEIQLVQQRVGLRFTRIDTRPGGVWHGRLDVTPRVLNEKRYSYAGTFAARWCSS